MPANSKCIDEEAVLEDNSTVISCSTTDTQELSMRKEKLYQWFVKHNGVPKRRWPGVVGDYPYRASASVRFNSPFYTVESPYKRGQKHQIYWGPYDPLRVILYLDNNGFVAKTPNVG